MTATPAELAVIAAARELRPLLWATAEGEPFADEAGTMLDALDALAGEADAGEALPRRFAGEVREARPFAAATFALARANPGEWILDSVSDNEPAAHNRASFLQRAAKSESASSGASGAMPSTR